MVSQITKQTNQRPISYPTWHISKIRALLNLHVRHMPVINDKTFLKYYNVKNNMAKVISIAMETKLFIS